MAKIKAVARNSRCYCHLLSLFFMFFSLSLFSHFQSAYSCCEWATSKKFDKHSPWAKHFNLQGLLKAVARNSRCYCHFPQGFLLLKMTIGRNFYTAPFQVICLGALNIWKWMIVCKRTLLQRMFALSVVCVYLLSSVFINFSEQR